MPIDELTRNAVWIGRAKVRRAKDANYRGSYSQIATLQPVDVIEGDFTLKELNVLSRSTVRCAEDSYQTGEELLVFLEPQDSLFHTCNFQYGQFPIVNDIVKGWRDANNHPVDKPYAEVRSQIIGFINAAQTPRTQEPPRSIPQPPAQKPPDSSAEASSR
jgi:hypothetical protein